MQVVGGLLGLTPKPKGPTAAEQAAQQAQAEAAFKDQSETDKLAALALNTGSRRQVLSWQDQRKKARLGG